VAELEDLPQKLADFVMQQKSVDKDFPDHISRSDVLSGIDEISGKENNDDSLWFRGGEWQALIDDAIENSDIVVTLRQRVSELEATVSGLESDNGELSDKLSQSEALRIDAEQAAQSIVTPNNCRHCQWAAEKMREAAATLSDEMFADEVADAIRALPLPACDGCNPLKPE
jgi:hypothetical protein